jgi:hypothetical protein
MSDGRDDRARLAAILQRIRDLVAHLWQVQALRELPLQVRETIAEALGCEAAAHGLDDEEPNVYGVELGEVFDALGL